MSDQRKNLDYGGDQLKERELRLRTNHLYLLSDGVMFGISQA